MGLMRIFLISFQSVAAIIVFAVAYSIVRFLSQCWTLRDFRGPTAVPILGNCYTPQALAFMKYISDLRKQYGRIFTFFAMGNAYLVISDPVVVRRILSDAKTFCKGLVYSKYFRLIFGDGLVTSGEEKHKADRSLLGKYFIRSNINKYVPNVNILAREAIEELNKDLTKSKDQNMEHFFALLAVRTFIFFGFSARFTREREEEYCDGTAKGSFLVGRLVGLGLPTWSFIPQVKQLNYYNGISWSFYVPFIEERKAALARGELKDVDDLLSAMLNSNMSQQDMKDHITTLIAAGHDTTTYFSSYLCMLLANHQDTQDRVREEMLSVVGTDVDVSPQHIMDLKFLQKVMCETLRLYAIIPSLSRKCTRDTYVKEANITIRKGTEILLPLFILNRDPELWDKPAEFVPDRFDSMGDFFTSAKHGFFPFGYGTRTCIGNTFAHIESAIFICHLVRKFRFIPSPGFKPNIIAGISLTTSNGIHICLEPL